VNNLEGKQKKTNFEPTEVLRRVQRKRRGERFGKGKSLSIAAQPPGHGGAKEVEREKGYPALHPRDMVKVGAQYGRFWRYQKESFCETKEGVIAEEKKRTLNAPRAINKACEERGEGAGSDRGNFENTKGVREKKKNQFQKGFLAGAN